jgi:hypothetical protein
MEQHLKYSNMVDPINRSISKLDGSLYVQLIFFPADRADQRKFIIWLNQRKSA